MCSPRNAHRVIPEIYPKSRKPSTARWHSRARHLALSRKPYTARWHSRARHLAPSRKPSALKHSRPIQYAQSPETGKVFGRARKGRGLGKEKLRLEKDGFPSPKLFLDLCKFVLYTVSYEKYKNSYTRRNCPK